MLPALLILAAVAAAVLSLTWHLRRSRGILDDWASSNGYRILEVERRYLRRGPFFLRAGEGHVVFRVAVEDPAGRARQGFVRVGGWWLGLLSDKVVVEWDD